MPKSRRLAIASDSHGDQIDPLMERKFFDWLDDYQPTLRIHAGDVFNFEALRKNASPAERQTNMEGDFEAGMDFMRRYFAGGTERYLLRGNHDERLWDLLYNESGPLHDLAKLMVRDVDAMLRKLKVTMLPYDARHGVLEIGHLRVIHGYRCGVGAGGAHARIYRNCIFGHTHTQEIVPVENLDGPSVAMGTGCICKIDQPYNARQTNKLRHQNGWVYGLMHGDGTYQVFQAKRIGDTINAATEIKVY